MIEPLADLSHFPPAAKYSYLDAASVSLTHKGAAASISEWQLRLAEEGTIAFDERDEVEVFDQLSDCGARLFNTTAENIAVASSETVLMSSLAWAVSPAGNTNLVATDISHPSSTYPWLRVARQSGAQIRWAHAENEYVNPEQIIALIDDQTSVVVLSHVEYGTGQTYDLARLADAAHAHGALVVVDATQSAGQVPIDVSATGVDAVACSTYKWLCGPFGSGLMYVAPTLQALEPGIVGWRSHEDMWDFQATRLVLPDSAKRYEFGTMAYGTSLGAALALGYLLEVGIEAIYQHNRQISARLRAGLSEAGAEILSPESEAERCAIVAARFPAHDSAEVAKRLKAANVVVSRRQDFLRFSPHLYNGSEDVDQALQVIGELVA